MARKKRNETEEDTGFDDLMEDFFRAGDEGAFAWEDEEEAEASGEAEEGADPAAPAECPEDSEETGAGRHRPVAGEVFEPESSGAATEEEAPAAAPKPERHCHRQDAV